jgi:hypothetical protein
MAESLRETCDVMKRAHNAMRGLQIASFGRWICGRRPNEPDMIRGSAQSERRRREYADRTFSYNLAACTEKSFDRTAKFRESAT